MASTTAAIVMGHTTSYLEEVISRPELRHRIISSARLKLPSPLDPALVRASTLLSQSLDNNFSSSSSSSSSAAITVEKILLSLPTPIPLSSLLLSIAYAQRGRHVSAGLSLLDLFVLDPALARSELAPPIYENLFIPHLLPVVQWFSDQRTRILLSPGFDDDNDDDDDEEEEAESRSMAYDAMSVLSRMSGGQAEELRALEKGYEDVMDENCTVYAEYLKKVLEGSDGLSPPRLFFMKATDYGGLDVVVEEEEVDDVVDEEEEEEESSSLIGLEKGQYNNPMWAEADKSTELRERQSNRSQNSNTRYSASYPRRVQPHLPDTRHTSNEENNKRLSSKVVVNVISDSTTPTFSEYDVNLEDSSSEYDPDIEESSTESTLFHANQNQEQRQEQTYSKSTSTSSPEIPMVNSDNGKQNPPKDFVCPITSNIFDDPVTLETGQTYERRAIQEWLDRGNSTCPITRQRLSSTQLPKTNYVLKRLIASWQEQNPYSTPIRISSQSPFPPPNKDAVQKKNSTQRVPSPTSVISQASIDNGLRLAISQLCTSEILEESEMAVLQIERLCRESSTEQHTILAALSKPAVVNGFVEILFNSVDPLTLRATIFLLTELVNKDKSVVQTLTRVDSDVECMVALFKKGLIQTVVLIYLLDPSWESLMDMDMIEALMMAVKRKDEEDTFDDMCLKPRSASVLILWQIMRGDSRTASSVAGALISARAVEYVVPSLETKLVEERIAAVGILVRCIEEDGNCRNMIADQAELAAVMESFSIVNDMERFEIVRFLNELVRLSRRTFNQQLLQIIKDEGVFSTMHSLLIYLQTALQDQVPVIAALLLQLDLLVEPEMMSIYREEAIDALISSLRDADFPNSQIQAAETICSLQGRFSYSGKPLIRAFLLKQAGMNKSYRSLMGAQQFGSALEDPDENTEEESAAEEWEKRMAFSLVTHEFGLLFEALADGMKSKNYELCSACLVSASWLVHMLSILPDTGIRGAARVCLLKRYISILKSSKNADDKALAMLALRSFMNDPEGMNDITYHIKDVMKTMRELKKSSVLAYEMLKLLSDGKESSTQELWNHKELNQVDCITNGEVLSIVYLRNWIFSGHSDGTIKVWSGSENILGQVHEIREHTKAVTSLAVLQSGDKLYSGSLDKTVRVWSVRDGKIACVEVHDMKDQIHNLAVANTIACFIPHGAGVKVFSWNGGSKLFNPNKYIKCLSLVHGKLYCGCHDNSIQEIDLATGTIGTIQTGNRKLLGKSNPVYAMRVQDGLLYSASTTSDGGVLKIYNASNYSVVGTLPCTVEVRSIAISTDLIYMGCKSGLVDIWSKEKFIRIGSLQTRTYSKVRCMALDGDGDVLVVGTSDGRIQAWGLT